jgi:hypothetical protein
LSEYLAATKFNVIESVFFHFENGVPKVYSVDFRVLNTPNERVKVGYRITHDTTSAKNAYLLGQHDHISALKNVYDRLYPIKEKAVLEMIRLENTHHPKLVGSHISVFSLRSNGKSWYRKSICP